MAGSIADVLREGRGYVTTLQINEAELPLNVKALREELAEAVAETEEAGVRQQLHTALVQQATQDQDRGRVRCSDLSTRVRNALRGFYGPANEALNQYGIRPRRSSRPPKPKPPEVVDPPQAATPDAVAANQE